MYNFSGFGARIAHLRKAKGMTQEDLADRMGVSGQAVSKWENDQSYPDITLLPALAELFGVDVNHLFGKEQAPPPAGNFPQYYENLTLVVHNQRLACYSNKEVSHKDDTGARFTDGSSAELTTRIITNIGHGDIRFVDAEEAAHAPRADSMDMSEREIKCTFGALPNIDFSVLASHFELTKSPDASIRVHATGLPAFIDCLRIEANADTLTIGFKHISDGTVGGIFNSIADGIVSIFGGSVSSIGDKRRNRVAIQLPYDEGNRASVKINGNGTLVSHIPAFAEGNLTVNGSGDIAMQKFTRAKATVNGSGDIRCHRADELSISINGSGDIQFDSCINAKIAVTGSGDVRLGEAVNAATRVTGSGDIKVANMLGGGKFSAKITGSGDIETAGSCESFDVDITGSGDVDATHLTARKAHIVVRQTGDVVLGRVLEESVEQAKSRSATISILQRG